MSRPQGSRSALIRITYDDIGRLAGISGNSAKQYANRGEFDSRSLDSALAWINARRTAKGLPLIGMPADEAVSDEDSEAVTRETPLSSPTRTSRGLFYDPLTASYQYNA